MANIVSLTGDNGFAPGLTSVNQSIADKLVAGNLKLVTTGGILASGSLQRGYVVGQISASGDWVACVKTASDGSQIPMGLLVDDADATAAPVECSVYQRGEFLTRAISFDLSWAIADLEAALRLQGVIFKSVSPAMTNDDPS